MLCICIFLIKRHWLELLRSWLIEMGLGLKWPWFDLIGCRHWQVGRRLRLDVGGRSAPLLETSKIRVASVEYTYLCSPRWIYSYDLGMKYFKIALVFSLTGCLLYIILLTKFHLSCLSKIYYFCPVVNQTNEQFSEWVSGQNLKIQYCSSTFQNKMTWYFYNYMPLWIKNIFL